VLPLQRPLLDEITLGAAGVAVLAFLGMISAHLRIGKLRRSFARLDGPDGPETVLDAIGRATDQTYALRGEVRAARSEVDGAKSQLADALRHVAVVRYDAFGDMGGRMSFTAALLDDSGDGLVITSINGRTESRCYAKGIKAGKGDATLSPEESQAITLALGRAAPA
jgi:hypothetical protein